MVTQISLLSSSLVGVVWGLKFLTPNGVFTLSGFFLQEQETAFFFLASVNPLANSHTNAIDFLCVSSLWKNWRSTKS